MLAWSTPGKGVVPGETVVREGFLEEMTFLGSELPRHSIMVGRWGEGSQVEGDLPGHKWAAVGVSTGPWEGIRRKAGRVGSS